MSRLITDLYRKVRNVNRLTQRLNKIEKKLEPEKSKSTRFPLPGGGFIEVPGNLSLVDILAIARASEKK